MSVSVDIQVVAALAGAVAGLVASGAVESVKWVVSRKRRAKAIKMALYYEIFRHHIYEVAADPETGDPNFMITGFSRAAYDAYLDEIPDLLPEKLVGIISMYYTDVTAAESQQTRIDEDAGAVRDAARELTRLQASHTIIRPVHPDEVKLAKQAGAQVAHRMEDMMNQARHLFATAMWHKERLLDALRETFDHDPAKEPVGVLPKYEAWFDREAAARGLKAIEKGKE